MERTAMYTYCSRDLYNHSTPIVFNKIVILTMRKRGFSCWSRGTVNKVSRKNQISYETGDSVDDQQLLECF